MPEQIKERLIEEEMRDNYIDYAMSVIVGRALPDVRDGLKPVHRRILYAMHELGLVHNKPSKKCARIVGEVLGKYHPHGDMAVYDSLARMAQNFSLRYPLITGQGNFGSVDGDSPAAMRYTEAKMSKIAEEILIDIEKNTVPFAPNFDNTLKEPLFLPSKLPNLLLNGSSGIAVGMATNIPPHNSSEIIDAVMSVIDNQNIPVDELLQIVKGPDFPTGALLGTQGLREVYATGRGKLLIRARTEIDGRRIIVTELPYQVNKAQLLENIAELIKGKQLEDISDLRDESEQDIRIVIDLKRDANPDFVLKQLFKHTQLQITYGVIMLALVVNEPRILNLRELIGAYIDHRKNIVTRRTEFELQKAEHRVHLLTGLKVALKHIEPIIKLIKEAETVNDARDVLCKNFGLTDIQSNAILDMKLQRLTALEQDKLEQEYKELVELIIKLKDILGSEKGVINIIKKELQELKREYADERRTEILEIEGEDEELIREEDVVIIVTNSGYIKRLPLGVYKQQRRGGRGVITTEVKEEDVVKHIFVTSTNNYLLFFTNKGRVYWLKSHKIPEASRYAKGKAIINLVNIKDEMINTVLPVADLNLERYVVMITKQGTIKKIRLDKFANPRKSGVQAIKLTNDELVQTKLTNGKIKLMIATKNGFALRFDESDIRPMGRAAVGVRGIKLRNDEVVGMEIAKDDAALLTVTENGFGKRTLITDYRVIRRGGHGVLNIKASERNGMVVGIKTIMDDDEIMLISKKGITTRILARDIPCVGRHTKGVRLMKLEENDKLAKVTRVIRK